MQILIDLFRENVRGNLFFFLPLFRRNKVNSGDGSWIEKSKRTNKH